MPQDVAVIGDTTGERTGRKTGIGVNYWGVNFGENEFGSPSETKGISRIRDTGKTLKLHGLLKLASLRRPECALVNQARCDSALVFASLNGTDCHVAADAFRR